MDQQHVIIMMSYKTLCSYVSEAYKKKRKKKKMASKDDLYELYDDWLSISWGWNLEILTFSHKSKREWHQPWSTFP